MVWCKDWIIYVIYIICMYVYMIRKSSVFFLGMIVAVWRMAGFDFSMIDFLGRVRVTMVIGIVTI